MFEFASLIPLATSMLSPARTGGGGGSSAPNMEQRQDVSQTQVNSQNVNIGSNVGQGAPSALDALSNFGILGMPQSNSLPGVNVGGTAGTPWGTYLLIGGGALLVWYFMSQPSGRSRSRALQVY